jgi:hypothetical protein
METIRLLSLDGSPKALTTKKVAVSCVIPHKKITLEPT